MAYDLGGPTTGNLGTTIRPGETRAASALDTWFQDCTTPDAEDGTMFASAIFNEWLAWMREIARVNGNTGGGSPVVAEALNDDALLLNAIRHLIQRGQPSYAVDSGTADALVVTLTPALAEYKAGGQPIWIKKSALANATTTPTVNINGLGAKTITNVDGTALDIGQLAADVAFSVVYDGTNMRIASAPRPATKTEAEAGVLTGAYISPATLFNRRTPYFFATGSVSQSIPDNADTKVTNLDTLSSSYFNTGSSYAADTFTCGAKDAGAWLFTGYSALTLATPSAGGKDYRAAIWKNGVGASFMSSYISEASTYGIIVSTPLIVAAGDTIDLRVFQNTGTNRNIGATQLVGVRLSGTV
jgi:hypothetical protein